MLAHQQPQAPRGPCPNAAQPWARPACTRASCPKPGAHGRPVPRAQPRPVLSGVTPRGGGLGKWPRGYCQHHCQHHGGPGDRQLPWHAAHSRPRQGHGCPRGSRVIPHRVKVCVTMSAVPQQGCRRDWLSGAGGRTRHQPSAADGPFLPCAHLTPCATVAAAPRHRSSTSRLVPRLCPWPQRLPWRILACDCPAPPRARLIAATRSRYRGGAQALGARHPLFPSSPDGAAGSRSRRAAKAPSLCLWPQPPAPGFPRTAAPAALAADAGVSTGRSRHSRAHLGALAGAGGPGHQNDAAVAFQVLHEAVLGGPDRQVPALPQQLVVAGGEGQPVVRVHLQVAVTAQGRVLVLVLRQRRAGATLPGRGAGGPAAGHGGDSGAAGTGGSCGGPSGSRQSRGGRC